MITARLRLPGVPEVVLEIPEREGRPDALDLLDAAVARIEGRDWGAVLQAARQAQAEGGRVVTPIPTLASVPTVASTALAPLLGGGDTPGSGVRATSRDALDRMRASGRLGRQEMLVYGFIRGHSGQDFTRQEVAQGLGLGINAACGRIHALIHDHGLLRETCRRSCRVTGESVMAISTVEGA